jgi:dolichol-phosphate mannosyltransferase
MTEKKVCVILPTLNEVLGLRKVLESMPNPVVDKVVVVDGNSTDGTTDVAMSSKKESFDLEIMNQEGKGKGMAFQTFLKNFDLDSQDIYIMLDADYTYDIREIEKMIFPLFNGTDVVMGDRFSGDMADAMTLTNYLGNRILTLIAMVLYKKRTKDVCTGYWAFSKRFLKSIKINAKGFDLEVNLFSEAVNKGFRIKSVPVSYRRRVGTKKLRIWHSPSILWRLVKESFNSF